MPTIREVRDELVNSVIRKYLNSKDFNGYPFGGVGSDSTLSSADPRDFLRPLIEAERIVVRYGNWHGNPFIRHLPDEPVEVQLKMLDASRLDLIVLYPTAKELKRFVKPSRYKDRPFSLMLALGAAQLEFRCFDLSVLEIYRNDPRYYYRAGDMSGMISVSDKYYQSKAMAESDQVLLQTFGFAYDSAMNRAVAVFLSYLHDLSPQHQQIWNARLLKGDFKLHPDYYISSVRGFPADKIPILDAFILELHHINKMASLMGKPALFLDTFEGENKPKDFTFLIRPTAREFNDFVLLLDHALSDNLNKRFFEGDIRLEEEVKRKDAKVEVRAKGTVRLLDEWLRLKSRTAHPRPVEEMLQTLRDVRKLRQTPAHRITDDEFDQKFFKQQRDLIVRAYKAVRLIRLLFARHPKVAGYSVEGGLFKGNIRDF
jgi:hypothetical protein